MRTELKAGAGERATLVICTALMAVLALFVSAAAVGTLKSSPLAAALVGASGAVLLGLAWLIGVEAAAALRLKIGVDGDSLKLDLPRRRGHVPLPAMKRETPLASVIAVEKRSEVFRQLGVTMVQEAYRVRLADGSAIVLGADRQMKAPLFGPAAELISERTKVPIADLGMVDGGAGFLAVIGASVPDWSAPSLAPEKIGQRRAAAARAFQLMTLTAALVTLARLIARR